jgi:DNA (cytosine-5)-methyltransferase 1
MSAFYNEINPFAAEWLRNLIAAGHIAPGVVDERSIEDVVPEELSGYSQCHFFAGVGVWSLALRRAGWPDDRPVWTGSCPCQPFSAAGKGAGFADERHLWPAFHHLISYHKPAVVFGEQVASKDADTWLDLVQADVEAMDYTFGCVPFPSASVGAPHIRDRSYWVGDSTGIRQFGRRVHNGGDQSRQRLESAIGGGVWEQAAERGFVGGMEYADGRNASAEWQQRSGEQRQQPEDCRAGWMGNTESGRLPVFGGTSREGRYSPLASGSSGTGPTNGLWRDADWIFCRDGKWRPVEPGTFPLAHGAASRVGRLRAYGNAINAEQAEEFIRSYQEAKLMQELMS